MKATVFNLLELSSGNGPASCPLSFSIVPVYKPHIFSYVQLSFVLYIVISVLKERQLGCHFDGVEKFLSLKFGFINGRTKKSEKWSGPVS